MPQERELTDSELQELQTQGYDTSKLKGTKVTTYTPDEAKIMGVGQQQTQAQDSDEPSALGAIASGLKQHGLSTAAGGVAGSAAMAGIEALLAPETGGLSLLPMLGTIAGGTAIGMGASAATQKAQEAVEGDETANRLNSEAAAGEKAHPWATGLSDVALGSLAGGFRPGITTGANMAKNAALQTGVGAATDLATGQPITGKGLLLSALGGAAFNKPFGPVGGLHRSEPVAEPLQDKTNPLVDQTQEPQEQVKQSPWTMQDDQGNYHLNNKAVSTEYGRQNPAPQRQDYGENYTQYQLDRKAYGDMDVSAKRQSLHDDWMSKTYTGEQQGPKVPVVKPPEGSISLTDEQTAKAGSAQEQLNQAQDEQLKPTEDGKLLLSQVEQKKNGDLTQQEKDANSAQYTNKPGYQDLINKIKTLDPQSPEFAATWKQIEALKNPNGGMPPTTESYLKDNDKATAVGLAHALSKEKPEYAGILKHIIGTGALDGAAAVHNDERPTQYDPSNRRVSVESKHLGNHDVILEELLHAATSDVVHGEVGMGDNDKVLQNYSGKNKGVKSLIDSYMQARNSGGKGLMNHIYQMSNLHEFLAGAFHDKAFASKLNGIKAEGETKSVFTKILDSVKSMLGFDTKQGSILEKVIDSAHEIFKDQGKGEIGKRGTEESEPILTKKTDEELPTRKGWISTIDNIRTHVSKPIADAFQKVLLRNDQNTGSTWNRIKATMDKTGFTKADGVQLDKIAKWENQNNSSAPSTMFRNAAQREVYKAERQAYTDSGARNIADKVPVYRNGKPTLLKQNPNGHPTPIDPEVAKVLRENTDKGKISQLKKDFVNSAVNEYKIPAAVAEKQFQTISDHLQGKSSSGSTTTPMFAGSRLPEGIPLPESWQKGNYVQRIETYYRRGAMDNAFYKHVESDPDVWSKLGNTQDAWGKAVAPSKEGSYQNNSYVKSQLEEFSSAHAGKNSNPIEKGATSLAAQLFVASPGIELHKVGSNQISALSYVSSPEQFAGLVKGMTNAFGSGLEHARENGLLKLTSRSVTDFMDKSNRALNILRSTAQLFHNVATLGGATERFSTGLLQGGLEGIMPDKISRANKGDKNEQQLLKRIDPSYTVGKTYNPKEVSQLASSLAGFIHGTHDGRTMPKWMQGDTEISGFAQLAHWSVAQTGRFMNDIVEPAKSGNYKPLVLSLFGSAIGGAIIKKMREEMQGKEGPIPSLNQIANSGTTGSRKVGLTAYNLVSAAQYAGFAGLFSTGVKDSMDLVYKNHPQGADFPLDEIATSLAGNVSQVASAMINDPNFNWGKASVEFAKNIATQNVQLARMGMNQAINAGGITGTQAEKKMLGDKMGELRKFEMTQGLPYQEQEPSTANPYMDIESKSFRNEPDPYKAAGQLPGIIQSIMQNNSSNPDVMQEKLKGLKSMQYASMPSPERMPIEFVRYIDFLKRTRGEEYANEAIKDFITHQAINKAKSSLIPSL